MLHFSWLLGDGQRLRRGRKGNPPVLTFNLRLLRLLQFEPHRVLFNGVGAESRTRHVFARTPLLPFRTVDGNQSRLVYIAYTSPALGKPIRERKLANRMEMSSR